MPKVKNVDEMKEHYKEAIPWMAKNWVAGKKKAIEEDRWCKGITAVTGKKCRSVLNEKWKAKLRGVTEEEYKSAVEAAVDRFGDRWLFKVTE